MMNYEIKLLNLKQDHSTILKHNDKIQTLKKEIESEKNTELKEKIYSQIDKLKTEKEEEIV